MIYNGNEEPVWASDTFETGPEYFVLAQNDGNLVIYENYTDAVWATDTFFSAPLKQRP